MKTRTSFVANSSSSSFIIDKYNLTGSQLDKIYDHTDYVEDSWDIWSIDSNESTIELSTMMDNFDMYNYLIECVRVKPEHIRRGNL